jgi:hypothetical protein
MGVDPNLFLRFSTPSCASAACVPLLTLALRAQAHVIFR